MTGAYKDMVVTHLFQVLAFVAMEPPAAGNRGQLVRRRTKSFAQCCRDPRDVVRGQYSGYRDEDGVARDSDTETFIALKCGIDNWRWAGVPFYCRTGKRMAEGLRIISIAFKEGTEEYVPCGIEGRLDRSGPSYF